MITENINMQMDVNQDSFNKVSFRRTIRTLTVCLALQLTGSNLLFTVFARKISAFGQGVGVFGISATAFSLTVLIAAPYMGMLADRYGRRKLMLGSLLAHSLASLGYLLATDGLTFVLVRALAGGLTAGLVPAATSMVGDLASQTARGRWIGFVSGWSAIGFVLGPPLGGWLYDQWGLDIPFVCGALLTLLAFAIAFFTVPETTSLTRSGMAMRSQPSSSPEDFSQSTSTASFWNALPSPLRPFLMLMVVCFIAVFAWRFVEPQFHFYIYDTLAWTSSRFGLIMSGYAVMLVLAETGLGQLSDRFGRKPILMVGLLIHSAQYAALIATKSWMPIAAGIALSGLGEGLFMPALNAHILDITPDRYRARIFGIRESAFTLGGLSGPLLVVWAVRTLEPAGIFMISGSLILLSAILVPAVIRK
jgi:MFS family permease